MLEIECKHCHKMFDSPIQVPPAMLKGGLTMDGNKFGCPHCKQVDEYGVKDLKEKQSS